MLIVVIVCSCYCWVRRTRK